MSIEPRKDRPAAAAVYADVIGSKAIADRGLLAGSLERAVETLNQAFRPALAEPFAIVAGDELRGTLTEPPSAPLCVSVMREELAPIGVRVAVVVDSGRDAPSSGHGRHRLPTADEALDSLKKSGRLTSYVGTGPAGDLLLNAVCGLVEPLLLERSEKQWEAIRAYRRLGRQRAVAERLGVTRQSIGDRLMAGNWRAVAEADAAVAGYLSYVCG